MDNVTDFVMLRVLPVLLIIMFGSLLFLPFGIWKSSCVSAEVYNRQNGTNWSCSEFFWASEQINSQTSTIKLKQ